MMAFQTPSESGEGVPLLLIPVVSIYMYITYLYLFREGKCNVRQLAIFHGLSVFVVHRSWLRPVGVSRLRWCTAYALNVFYALTPRFPCRCGVSVGVG
jgi:hypothetical protein